MNHGFKRLTIVLAVVAMVMFATIFNCSNPNAAQKRRQQSSIEVAQSDWSKFWPEFQNAVRKHDRKALISVMSNPFGCANEESSPAECLKYLDAPREEYVSWRRIASAVRTGTKGNSNLPPEGVVARRVSSNQYLVFDLGHDGKWRWSAIWSND
jgi:hypothetical protein